MILEILSPDSSLFSGEVNSVQLPGVDGLFEVLDLHAPLIAALGAGPIRVSSSEGEKIFKVNTGIVEVLNNKVSVLVEGLLED